MIPPKSPPTAPSRGALELARDATRTEFAWQWIATRDLRDVPRDLAGCAAVWAVPGSAYANTAGVLDAIRWARETRRPFLGTCGGFQHALIEFARHVAGLADADHAETNPRGESLAVTRLACSLVEQTATLRLAPGSLIRAATPATPPPKATGATTVRHRSFAPFSSA